MSLPGARIRTYPLVRPTVEGTIAMGIAAVLGLYLSSVLLVVALAPFIGGAVGGGRVPADELRGVTVGLAVGSIGVGLVFVGAIGALALDGWAVQTFTAAVWTIFLLVWASLLLGIAGLGGLVGAALRGSEPRGESLDFGQYEPPGGRIEPRDTPGSDTETDRTYGQTDEQALHRNASSAPAANGGFGLARAVVEGTAVALGGVVLATVAFTSGPYSRFVYGRYLLLPAVCLGGGFVAGYRSPPGWSTALYSGLWVGLLAGLGTALSTGLVAGWLILFLGPIVVLTFFLAALGGLLGGRIRSQRQAEAGT